MSTLALNGFAQYGETGEWTSATFTGEAWRKVCNFIADGIGSRLGSIAGLAAQRIESSNNFGSSRGLKQSSNHGSSSSYFLPAPLRI